MEAVDKKIHSLYDYGVIIPMIQEESLMAKEKTIRDKAAEKAVKDRLKRTHLKSIKVLGSNKGNGFIEVFILRTVGVDNYLFKVNCIYNPGGRYTLSGLIPVNDKDKFGEYRVYNPKTNASADALKPTEKEKSFIGYGK